MQSVQNLALRDETKKQSFYYQAVASFARRHGKHWTISRHTLITDTCMIPPMCEARPGLIDWPVYPTARQERPPVYLCS